MAESRDDRVSAAYRELPGEGPPPALDAAIHAAARRAVGSRPGGARRWQIPVSIAAVLALAIGISLQVEREKPLTVDGTPVSSGSAEYPVPQASEDATDRTGREMRAAAPAAAIPGPPAKEPTVMPQASLPVPEAKRTVREPVAADSAVTTVPAAPSPAQATAPATPAPTPMPPAAAIVAPAPLAAPPAAAGLAVPSEAARAAPQANLRAKSEMTRDAASRERTQAEASEPPEKRLERIAELRSRGLHEEADRALAEFRRTYPAYRLSEEWLRKVERP